MKKYTCDLCGSDTNDDQEYSLPIWLHICGGRGTVILMPKFELDIDHYNLCKNCKKELADFVYEKQQKYLLNQKGATI
ncbi:MAG: hypothetical protein LLF98_01885 [Clostridium sp.]|uniref:hypothetical protein n=1 Tax=Clostridium sp. TaxID=1506 RepID=UPI0025C5B47F|nr:hypothetical protein [Clostridium sp.]MCE5220031.1 hypothetical protein [Clostridium sp.]